MQVAPKLLQNFTQEAEVGLIPSMKQQQINRLRPIAIDLFSGAGGLSLGLEAAGFDVALSVEIDPIHSAVHQFNFPLCTTLCRNISNLSTEEILDILKEKKIESIDLVAGGPPCQGFSQIGYRHLNDPRNNLVFEFFRLIRDLRPKYFIFENVPGIVKGKHKQFLEELCQDFHNIGYETISPTLILNAADFGVAQSRSRLILLGWRRELPKLTYPSPLFQKPDNHGQYAPLFALPGWLGASDVLADLTTVSVYLGDDHGINPSQLDYSGYRESFSFTPMGLYSFCHRRTFTTQLIYGHKGSQHTKQSITNFENAPPGVIEARSRLFKLHPHKPSHTLRAGTDSKRGAYTAPRPIHYAHPRCISIREAARLHSFPDWFQFHRTIWHGHREIGNAVPPLFAKEIAQGIVAALGYEAKHLPIYELPTADVELLSLNMQRACEYFGVPTDVIGTRNRKSSQVKKIA